MPVLHRALQKTAHHKCLTGLWEFFSFSICYGLNMQGLRICQDYTGFCVNCILKIHVIWMSWVLNMLRFWMYQEPKYAISYKGFWIKYLIIYICQSSEYTTVSKYLRVLNILVYIWNVHDLKPEFFILFWIISISCEF